MKIKGAVEKWASGVLGAVCLVLLMNLARSGAGAGGAGAGGAKPNLSPVHSPEPRKTALPPSGIKDELSRYDPELKLDVLTAVQARTLPENERNPFEFPPKPVPKPPPGSVSGSGPQLPPPPPPPPPVPLKLVAYAERAGGAKEAVIASTVPENEVIYVVHEGEIFAKNYRVSKITEKVVEIVEESTRRVVQLPIAAAAP